MLSKIFVFTLLCFYTLQIIEGAPKSSQSAKERAQSLYDSLVNVIEDAKNRTTVEIEETTGRKIQEAALTIDPIVDVQERKWKDARSKVEQIEQTLESVGIQDCTQGYLSNIEAVNTRWVQRTKKCISMLSPMIYDFKNRSIDDMDLLQNGMLECHSRSLEECNSFAKDDSCYEFLIGKLEAAIIVVDIDFTLIKANFLNKIAGFKLPCQDLIEFEISVNPFYDLQVITQCAETRIRNSQKRVCNN